ncbi:hypothetical protein NTGM5_180041 [Candidatus Nitrotoga sp. M5]|nr:hypothetical protein NTGM5_180041 [Candidatus Nitrotoga sp. M5]
MGNANLRQVSDGLRHSGLYISNNVTKIKQSTISPLTNQSFISTKFVS